MERLPLIDDRIGAMVRYYPVLAAVYAGLLAVAYVWFYLGVPRAVRARAA